MLNKINLPTASKQNEIHEDVKQLKESSGAGKKYVTRIHKLEAEKGEVAEISFKGTLVSISITPTSDNGRTSAEEIKIDGKDVITDDTLLDVGGPKILNLDLNIPVKNNFSIKCPSYTISSMYIYIVVKHEVNE